VSDYAGGTKTDWFLPSIGELMLMYTNLRQLGVGSFSLDGYWSSSEFDADNAWGHDFGNGLQYGHGKNPLPSYVRPVRAF
jgi:hypothetical protein